VIPNQYISQDDVCCICTDEYVKGDINSIMICGHKFHKKCIDTWLSDHATCPCCRCNMYQEYIQN
jgi:hypothetical protein